MLPIIQDIISRNATRSVLGNLLLRSTFFLSPVSLRQNPPAELLGPCERGSAFRCPSKEFNYQQAPSFH